MEQAYAFRQRLLQRHRYDLRQAEKAPGQTEIDESYIIAISHDAGRVIENAALDLQEYLRRSMDVALAVKRYKNLDDISRNRILIKTCDCLEPVSGACKVKAAEGCIVLAGYDERGAAQACYRAQDQMTLNMGPYLEGEKNYVPKFSPRMSHSGYGLDDFPDAHLQDIAHAGMDSILVFVKDVNLSPKGYLDFNTLIWRAAGFGLDVYAYSYYHSERNPEDPDAFEHYNGTYGKLFESCPGLKGVVFVGESCAFPSKDPRVSGVIRQSMIDGIPSEKPRSGWFPCSDYPQWLNYVKDVIFRYKPDADIVFWTYNWGNAPEADRLALLDNLPTDISLMVTFEMYDNYSLGDLAAATTDYTICVPGPGPYFVSEAKKAKERGIRLYTQANAAGLAWDFGTIPYEPMPYQWMKRWAGLVEAADKWGLKTIGENIHYGFHPSLMSELEKFMFFTPYEGATPEQWLLKLIARDFGEENVAKVDLAFRKFSEAITYYPATNEDQYGAFRTGPSFPFWMQDPRVGLTPLPNGGRKPVTRLDAHQYYWAWYTPDIAGRNSLPGVRIYDEIELVGKVRALMQEGMDSLNTIEGDSRNLEKLKALTTFIINSCTTVIHIKEFYIKLQQLSIIGDKEKAENLLNEIEALLIAERKNAEATIPAVQADSRLGWEPMQDYLCDEEALRWKMRQIDYTLEFELAKFRKSNSL